MKMVANGFGFLIIYRSRNPVRINCTVILMQATRTCFSLFIPLNLTKEKKEHLISLVNGEPKKEIRNFIPEKSQFRFK